MSFYKKVLLLKETERGFSIENKSVSGICRLEIENGVAELNLTIVHLSLKDDTAFNLMLIDSDKKIFNLECGKRPTSKKFSLPLVPNVKKGFAVGLYCIKDELPLTILFASTDNSFLPLYEFKKKLAEKCLQERKAVILSKTETQKPAHFESQKPQKTPQTITNEEEFLPKNTQTVNDFYDDEAVATTNYYDFDVGLEQKLDAVKEWNEKHIRVADAKADNRSQEETQQNQPTDNFFEDEKDDIIGEEFSKEHPYINTVRGELENIFRKFENLSALQKIFPKSKWAKINYSKSKYYVVGVISEDDAEKYICYGVPATYSPNPPKELKGFCTFIPLSIFDLSGEGFWMMFQDVISGECIRPKPPFD